MKKFLAFSLASIIGLTACAGGGNGGSAVNPGANPSGSEIGAEATPLADFSNDIGGEITVYTFDSMLTGPFLEEAAQMFMYKHPDTVINIETFSSMPEVRRAEGTEGAAIMVATQGDMSAERRDYINMVNTELMSGRGPDILALDVLPFHEYARNGFLVNLREFMYADSNFDINDYRVNIFEALNSDLGQFIFPVDYAFRYVAYGTELIDLEPGGIFSFENLIELGQQRGSAAGADSEANLFNMSIGPARGLFQEMFTQNYGYFVDLNNRQANFNTGTFADMLNLLIYLEQNGYVQQRASAPEAGAVRTPEMMLNMMNEEAYFRVRQSAMLINEFQQHGDGIRGGMQIVVGAGDMVGSENSEIAGILGNEHGEVPFTVHQGFGINSNSQNQHTAWEFIKFLSSEAVRQSMRMRGLPTHIEAFEERAMLSITGELFSAEFGGQVREMDATDQEALADYIAKVEYFTNQLNTFLTVDTMIEDIVLTEVREFFDGSRNAEDVAQTLQSRIHLFLNE